jgi:glycerophosphoryl diester phosphodiesterase
MFIAPQKSTYRRPRAWLLSLILPLVSAGCFSWYSIEDLAPLTPQPALERTSIAHRGSLHRGLPDNSIPALRETLRAGVPFAELDVRLSTEGDLFLFHDGSVQPENSYAPTSLVGRKIQELTRQERAQVWLDAAHTISIPTLHDALSVLKELPGTLQLDLKAESDALLDAVIQEIQRTQTSERVRIQLRDGLRIIRTRSAYPHLHVAARCVDSDQLSLALREKVEAVELERWITEDAVMSAHNARITVIVNIASTHLDEPHTWEYLRARGVDSIMSDHADLALLKASTVLTK